MFFLLCFLPHFINTEFSVEFSNILEAKGSLYVAVYDHPDAFMEVEKVRVKKVVQVSQTGTVKISLGTLPPGNYALSCFHDLNGNGKLDTNLLGIPTEPYGFSNNARPKFRAPKWTEAMFNLNEAPKAIKVRLEKWN